MSIPERIKRRREELHLTIQEVADKVGVSKSTISRYETEEIMNMKLNRLEPLARVLQCTPEFLMGWESQPAESGTDCLLNLISHRPELRTLLLTASKASKAQIEQLVCMLETFRSGQ